MKPLLVRLGETRARVGFRAAEALVVGMLGKKTPTKTSFLATMLVMLLAPLGAVSAAPNIVGFVDGINGSFAGGWACVQGQNQPVNIAVYFGLNLLGVFPTTVQRSDIGSVCGPAAGTYGFSLNFVPNLNQQLLPNAVQVAASRNAIAIYAIANGYASLELPPSTSGVANPFTVPSGSLSGAGSNGNVTGSVTGPNASPPVAVYAGASQTSGGSPLESPTVSPSGPNAWSFSLNSQQIVNDFASHPPIGFNLPIYAQTSDTFGSPIQLWNPIPVSRLVPALSPVTLYNQAVESGQFTGVRNSVFTTWYPNDAKLAGLAGSISLSGTTDNNFSEALIVLGVTRPTPTGGQTLQDACTASSSNLTVNPFPAITRLYGAILKNNSSQEVSIPINFALPYGIPLNGASGTCLTTIVSAGYPYPPGASYTTTTANIVASLTPAPDHGPATFSPSTGGEFHMGIGASQATYGVVALKMQPTATQLDLITESVSAAGVIGTTHSPWYPVPVGNWTANTNVYFFPAADCSALPVQFTSGGTYWYSAVGSTGAGYVVPTDVTLLASTPLLSYNGASVSLSTVTAFASGLGVSRVSLNKNDCIVSLHSVSSPGDSLNGNIDFEDQSTAYFRVVTP